MVDGSRRWVTYEDLELDDSDFGDIGAAFADAGHEHTGPAGAGVARLCATCVPPSTSPSTGYGPIANERTAPKPLRSTAMPRTVLSCTSERQAARNRRNAVSSPHGNNAPDGTDRSGA